MEPKSKSRIYWWAALFTIVASLATIASYVPGFLPSLIPGAGKTTQTDEDADAVVITIDANGQVYLGMDPVQADSLTLKMFRLEGKGATGNVYIRADVMAQSAIVSSVLAALDHARIPEVIFGDPPKALLRVVPISATGMLTLPVRIAPAQSAFLPSPADRLIVDYDGTISWNGEPVHYDPDFRHTLEGLPPKRQVLIAPHKLTRHLQFVNAIVHVQRAGIKNVTVLY